MSISKPRAEIARNPATKFIEWKGGSKQGYHQYFDKSANDGKGENKHIDLSCGFAILDMDLMSITGFDQDLNCGITSNEVVKNTDQKLIIKLWNKGKATVILEGSYAEIKDKVDKDKRLNYTQNVYAMLKGELVHIKYSGMCLSSWYEDIASKPTNAWVLHVETKDGQRGNVEYKYPIFAYGNELSEMEFDKAIEIDSKILQPYLESYLKAGGKVDEALNQDTKNDGHSDLPVEKWREVKAPSGDPLGKLTFPELQELSDSIDPESPLQDYIMRAIQDYSNIQKTWKDKAGSSGKKLSEYSIDEIKGLIKLIEDGKKWTAPTKQYFEVALNEMLIAEQNSFADAEVLDEDDDIPF